MDGSIRLSAKERKACLKAYRSARAARRALVLVLLAGGRSYRQIGRDTLASPTLIAAVKRDFELGGLARVLETEPRSVSVASWLIVVTRWLLSFTPRDFGFFRSRWSCELLALLLWEREGIRVSPETVRRGMRRMEFVWRRPRPVVGPRDPEHATKLRQIQRMIAALPSDETVVFQDEVDVHLNPKIGPCWMVRGEQADVVTPGNNEKRHLAGSLHWRTGRLLLSPPGRRRDAALFVEHLDDLRRQLRGYRVIHVVCDNASFHDCRAVRDFLAHHRGRSVLQSFTRRFSISRELFVGPEETLHVGDRLVKLSVNRSLVDPVSRRPMFHRGVWWAAADPGGHKSILRKGQIPAGQLFFHESGSVATHLIHFIRLVNLRDMESYTVELHPEDGRIISIRHSLSRFATYLMMQPNDHELLRRAISFMQPPEC